LSAKWLERTLLTAQHDEHDDTTKDHDELQSTSYKPVAPRLARHDSQIVAFLRGLRLFLVIVPNRLARSA
jgi:hypothetical protein